jgi:hypothetical protein
MEIVLVERSFGEPVRFEDVQRLEREATWCLDLYRVRFLHTYVARDGMRMVCVYEAPDAESVRLANETAKLPFERVYTVSRFGS